MNTYNDEQSVIEKLALLEPTPPRNAGKAAQARAQFLSEVKGISESKLAAIPVSLSQKQRLNGWVSKFRNVFPRKERFSMLTTLATIITVVALALGGAGATVYAAQDSLPNDLLYPVKLSSEAFRMTISTETQSQFKLALEFANRRVDEVVELASNGEAVPQEVMTQLQTQLETAFQMAAGMSDSEMTPALMQLQTTVRQQQQTMAGLGDSSGDAVMLQLRQMLQTQAQLCELGLTDPLMFRIRVRQQISGGEVPEDGTGLQTGQGNGAQNGAGTGECTSEDCVPVEDGTGPGPGPNAGNGDGTGECTSEDCVPVQDGTGPGPGPNPDPGTGDGNSSANPGNGNTDSGSGNNNSGNNNPSSPTSPDTGESDNSGGNSGGSSGGGTGKP